MAKAVFRRRNLGLHPKPKGRPSMKPKELIPSTKDQSVKSDKERIKELEAEIARLKYEMSFTMLYERNA